MKAPPIRSSFGTRACAILCVTLIGLTGGCSPTRLWEAMLMLQDIQAVLGPSRLKDTTPSPIVTTVEYSVDRRIHVGDLYRPGLDSSGQPGGALAAMVLVPGVTPDGKDDLRLTAMARTLARSRFEVLVPEIPNLRKLRVSPTDSRAIADAVIWLGRNQNTTAAALRSDASPAPVALSAISYAVGPAVLALLEPDTAGRVSLMVSVGGYYDIESLIAFFTTGAVRDPRTGAWSKGAPHPLGKWVFAMSNAHRLETAVDRVTLEAIARRKMDDLDASIEDLRADLLADGRSVLALLENTDRERVPDLIASLPAVVRRDLQALDLRRQDLRRIDAEIVLIHGRHDPVIPSAESIGLQAAWRDGKAHLYLVDGMQHAEGESLGLSDMATLLGAATRVLEIRDLAAGL